MSAATQYQDYRINARIKIAALWASMLFIFAYVDLFSLFRADVRADLEAGKMFAFTVGQGFLLGVTIYIMLPALMLFLSLVLPPRVARMTNIILAVLYAVTAAGSAIGDSNYYYILGSLTEAALMAGVIYYAWNWPKTTDAASAPADQSRVSTPVHSAPRVRE